MHYAYLGSNVISCTIWLVLYLRRQDLRRVMLTMSFCALPLAIFDLIFVPTYWQPITLFNVPVGIEGFLFSFTIGGIAAVLYAELKNRTIRHTKARRQGARYVIWIPLISLAAFWLAYAFNVPDPEITAYFALLSGTITTLFMRPDLLLGSTWGAIAFGTIYFLSVKAWLLLFPNAENWFILQGLPRVSVLDVPGSEILFGFLFGAFWSTLYEALLGYSFVPIKLAKPFKKSS